MLEKAREAVTKIILIMFLNVDFSTICDRATLRRSECELFMAKKKKCRAGGQLELFAV